MLYFFSRKIALEEASLALKMVVVEIPVWPPLNNRVQPIMHHEQIKVIDLPAYNNQS